MKKKGEWWRTELGFTVMNKVGEIFFKKRRKEKGSFQTSTHCIPIVGAREVSDSFLKKDFKVSMSVSSVVPRMFLSASMGESSVVSG